MTILKIRGGDLDLVEYEFTSFYPGENMNTCGYEGNYPLSPSKNTIRTKAPGRIHLTVLDMNRFAPGHPGGGGIGFAIEVYAEVEVRCIDNGFEINYSRPAIIRHFLSVFSKTVGYTGGFAVTAKDHDYKHVGLGSTSTILTALSAAVNRALGDPLTLDQLRILIGNNYVEETEGGLIAYGFETGVGPAVSGRGGMAILGDNLTIVHQHPFAEGKNVHIVIPPSSISSAGEEEFSLLMNKARSLDYRDRELKAYIVMMDFIPALNSGDLKKMGDSMWEMEFRGSKRAEIEHHSFELYQYMHRLRKAGLEFIGMSSVGPSIAVITDMSRDVLSTLLQPLQLEIAVSTKVNNSGLLYL
ncbi:GHMP kinase [Methanospirillum sp.]|mgnify:CR=1 FL=1|uniref:GHMP kinase n=1 Tax=Methanospirillum sp. TaxID=45200 RepID=UPI002BC4CA71|nr:GHMP kinase [Methanospirillum sp.]HOL42039.1 GHMP kinase [Methanospirillum sp.]HPP77276.1 GHMP kinase [Methanospirillum sp.]